MGRWIEIPGHRIYEVTHTEIQVGEYELLSRDGGPRREGEEFYFAARKKDGKLFVMSKFVPSGANTRDCLYLEEMR